MSSSKDYNKNIIYKNVDFNSRYQKTERQRSKTQILISNMDFKMNLKAKIIKISEVQRSKHKS